MGGFVKRCADEGLWRRRALGVKRAFLVICLGLGLFLGSWAHAQDDFFKPVIEVTPTIRREGPTEIFSFARLERDFKALCKGLEEDGRRERIVSIAQAGVAREKVCITCRSFWKMVVNSCAKLGPRPTPTPKPPKKKKGKAGEDPVEVATPQSEIGPSSASETSGESQEALATPTPPAARTKREIRYPSTEVLDEASRVSSSMYALDGGEGQEEEMFRYFAKTVREAPDLSPTELEYYDLFFTYLLAAWAGRVDASKMPPPTPAVDVNSFFE
jgi:hypothetical protein